MSEYIHGSGCDNCERSLPDGCLHIYGDQKQCKVGPRLDMPFVVGKAIVDKLENYRGFRHTLDNCTSEEQVGIIESLGKAALAAAAPDKQEGK